MRAAVALLLTFVLPLSGCLTIPGFSNEGVFGAWDLPAGDPTPVAAASCPSLLDDLNDRALREADTLLAQAVANVGRYWRGAPEMAVADAAASDAAAGSAASAEVTGTNNQEAGVDEADLLKTDGEWTYVVEGRTLHILHSQNVGDIAAFARVDLGEGVHGAQLLLEPRDPDDPDDDRLVVITQSWHPKERAQDGGATMEDSYYWNPGQQRTHIQVLDLADRAAPAVLESFWVEGANVGARLVEGHAYIVVQAHQYDQQLRTSAYPTESELEARGLTWQEYHELGDLARRALMKDVADDARRANRERIANATLDDHLPQVLVPGQGGDPTPRPYDATACRQVHASEDSTGRSATTIVALSTAEDRIASRFTQVLGSSPIVYAADDALVLAAPARDAWWFWGHADVDEATDLHWFDLDGLDVRHRASGRAAGTVLDSFGLDVHADTLRVATTTGRWGRWWLDDPEPMMSHVAVFEEAAGQLVPAGLVGGIAPGERIWSTRFTDDRAYVVTFEQIDPLWIIDLTNPRVPKILGELEIPGVSTYIHPLSDDLLLTIGLGPGRDGQGLDWGRIQVSLFDIRDTSSPRRVDVMDITPGNGYSWSGAVREHKAFTYWAAIGTLAVPVSTYYEYRVPNEYGTEWRYVNHVGLRLIDVDEQAMTLDLHGDVDQGMIMPPSSEQQWGLDVERSYFLGFPGTDVLSVYAMSRLGVTSHDLATLEPQDGVAFQDA